MCPGERSGEEETSEEDSGSTFHNMFFVINLHGKRGASEQKLHISPMSAHGVSRRVKPRDLTREDIANTLHMTQLQAARHLGICLSSLQRQYKEKFPQQRWPSKKQREQLKTSISQQKSNSSAKTPFFFDNDNGVDSSTETQHSSTLYPRENDDIPVAALSIKHEPISPRAFHGKEQIPNQYEPINQRLQSVVDQCDNFIDHTTEESLQYSQNMALLLNQRAQYLRQQLNQQREYIHSLQQEIFSKFCFSNQYLKNLTIQGYNFRGNIASIQGPWQSLPKNQLYLHHAQSPKDITCVFLLDKWANLIACNDSLWLCIGYRPEDLIANRFHMSLLWAEMMNPEKVIIDHAVFMDTPVQYLTHNQLWKSKTGQLLSMRVEVNKLNNDYQWSRATITEEFHEILIDKLRLQVKFLKPISDNELRHNLLIELDALNSAFHQYVGHKSR